MSFLSAKTARVSIARAGQTLDDHVAVEDPLEIRLAECAAGVHIVKTVAITMRTPGDDHDLAAGFLFTEGIVSTPGDIYAIDSVPTRGFVTVTLRDGATVEWKRLERHFYTSSSCGVCGKASVELVRTRLPARAPNTFRVTASVLCSLPATLRAAQESFTTTGGLHAAGLFTAAGELIAIREDVGRHNAVDKVIASEWRQGLPLDERVLMLSGRASFELIQKAAMAGIPVVAAVGAPSSLAIELAESAGVTLAGFVREDRWNLYCGDGVG